MKRSIVVGALIVATVCSAEAQYLENFDGAELAIDQSGLEGWSFFSGDGEATIDLVATGHGHATIVVDATRDRKNVWWALIRHRVSEQMDPGDPRYYDVLFSAGTFYRESGNMTAALGFFRRVSDEAASPLKEQAAIWVSLTK